MGLEGSTDNNRRPREPADIAWSRRLGEAKQAVDSLHERIERDWRTFKAEQLRAACDDVKLVVDFIHRFVLPDEVSDRIRAAVRADKAFVDAFEGIRQTVDRFPGYLGAIDQEGPDESYLKELASQGDELRQKLGDAINAFDAVLESHTGNDRVLTTERANALRLAREIRAVLHTRQLVQARQFAERAEQARDVAVQARDDTRKLAGDAAADSLGVHYADYAKEETTAADGLRRWAGVLLASAAAIAVALNLWLREISLGTELVRLSAVLPIVGLATYLAHESSKHRAAAKWAKDQAIAMHTLRPYTHPLDDIGNELRRALGLRVFGPAPGQSATSKGEGPYDDLAKALDMLAEAVRRIRDISLRSKSE
jgi:hypothetical protein